MRIRVRFGFLRWRFGVVTWNDLFGTVYRSSKGWVTGCYSACIMHVRIDVFRFQRVSTRLGGVKTTLVVMIMI
jgi:hypothetical protein